MVNFFFFFFLSSCGFLPGDNNTVEIDVALRVTQLLPLFQSYSEIVKLLGVQYSNKVQ